MFAAAPLVLLIFVAVLALLPATGTIIAVSIGLRRPELLPRIARIGVVILVVMIGLMSVSGWLVWESGPWSHQNLTGITAFILIITTPITIGGVFTATRSIVRRISGLIASLIVPVIIVFILFNPDLRLGHYGQARWFHDVEALHLIVAPVVSFVALVTLLFVLQGEQRVGDSRGPITVSSPDKPRR